MAGIVSIDELRRPAKAPRGWSLWSLGFRPFYLLASVFAALSIALWSAQFAGWLGATYLPGPLWHAHEMLFGFALAVIVGFLFTAGRNWTNRPTPSGLPLALLALVWLAGRVLVATPHVWASALVNAAFPIAAAIGLAIPLRAAGNRRNYFFVGLLVMMGLADLALHLSVVGVLALPAFFGVRIGLDVLLFVMAVMAGRVVPMFTNNGVPGAGAERRPAVDRIALAALLALVAADAAGLEGALLALVAGVAAAAHAVRWLFWKPWRTLRVPLVWILHAGYAWIVVHLALRSAAELGLIASSPATHALTAGGAGALIIGMMTRTSRGHTGRSLQADGFDVASYVLVVLSALVRVGVPLCMPALTVDAVIVSAALWCAGFALFAIRYAPSLVRPRLDGKPG
jgi:uncharacterized protein involved in response to NO